jgi:hypothetical protein
MAKDRSYEDRIFSIGRQGQIRTETLANGGVTHRGTVATVWGYVVVRAWLPVNGVRSTNLNIIHDREVYVRRYDEYFRPQTLVRLANQFAADVVSGRINDSERSGE